jgi:hypothetical protein
MEATIGDQICIHGDGRTRLLFPGPDAVIVPQQRRNQEG